MNKKRSELLFEFFVFVFLGALASIYGLDGAHAQRATGAKWCNAYLSHAWLQNETTDFSSDVIENEPLKIKYGKNIALDGYSAVDAIKWWVDFVIAPDNARDKRILYFYAISEMTDETMSQIVRHISESSGNEKPLFAVAMSTKSLKDLGITSFVDDRAEFVATPVWWNADLARTIKTAASTYNVNPSEAKNRLADLIGYTVVSSTMYDPHQEVCNPPHIPNEKLEALANKFGLESKAYIGVAEPILDLKAAPTRVVVPKRAWPVTD